MDIRNHGGIFGGNGGNSNSMLKDGTAVYVPTLEGIPVSQYTNAVSEAATEGKIVVDAEGGVVFHTMKYGSNGFRRFKLHDLDTNELWEAQIDSWSDSNFKWSPDHYDKTRNEFYYVGYTKYPTTSKATASFYVFSGAANDWESLGYVDGYSAPVFINADYDYLYYVQRTSLSPSTYSLYQVPKVKGGTVKTVKTLVVNDLLIQSDSKLYFYATNADGTVSLYTDTLDFVKMIPNSSLKFDSRTGYIKKHDVFYTAEHEDTKGLTSIKFYDGNGSLISRKVISMPDASYASVRTFTVLYDVQQNCLVIVGMDVNSSSYLLFAFLDNQGRIKNIDNITGNYRWVNSRLNETGFFKGISGLTTPIFSKDVRHMFYNKQQQSGSSYYYLTKIALYGEVKGDNI